MTDTTTATKYPPGALRYAPQGDSDGETIGIDHFVTDAAGNEVCVAPDEESGRLFAAAPELLAALEAIVGPDLTYFDGSVMTGCIDREKIIAARAAIRKAKRSAS